MSPEAARREVETAIGLLPLLVCDWKATWYDTVLATDASETGYGICQRKLPITQIRQIAQVSERRRYLDPLAVGARDHALGLEHPNLKGSKVMLSERSGGDIVPGNSYPVVPEAPPQRPI